MYGKKLYAAMLVIMTLLAALGAWAMVDGAISWRQRPRVMEYSTGVERLAALEAFEATFPCAEYQSPVHRSATGREIFVSGKAAEAKA